jgi:N-acylglucosamine 2-epimerase
LPDFRIGIGFGLVKPLDRATHQDQGRRAIDALKNHEGKPMADWLREHLFGHIMPFWDDQWDQTHGGLFTCIADDGEVIAGDKWLWSQWRAVWVYARIFNTLDPDPKWRDRAVSIANFCVKHGWLPEERGWALLLSEEGMIKRGSESIYVDAFAIYGMSELAQATGDETWLQRARQTADAAVNRIEQMGDQIPHFPYPILPGSKPHGIPMIYSLKFAALAQATGDTKYRNLSHTALAEIDCDFYDVAADRIWESADREGGARPSGAGQVTLPGHVIEGLWFCRLVDHAFPRDQADDAETWRRMRRHLDLGWEDASGGGILLAVENGSEPAAPENWPFAETKLWWPQTEALFATLLGWQETNDAYWIGRYEQLWELAWQHYVDWTHGEWRQKLNRDLSPFAGTVALPVKDPFHLPRSLILQIELLESGQPPTVATLFSH